MGKIAELVYGMVRNAMSFLGYKSGLPFIFGSLFMFVSGSYMAAEMYAITTIGRPSSTFAIGYFQVPFVAFGLGACGFLLGSLISKSINKFRPALEHIINIKHPLILILFFTSLSFGIYQSAIKGYGNIEDFEERSKPHVISTIGVLSKVSFTPYDAPILIDAVKMWDLSEEPDKDIYSRILSFLLPDKERPSITWNNRQITVISDDDVIIVQDNSGNRIAHTNLKKYNYTREVWAVPVRFYPDKAEYLAIFAHLRSTAHRAMLMIYDPSGSLVYHEIMERIGWKTTFLRKVCDPNSHQEAIEVNTHKPFFLSATGNRK